MGLRPMTHITRNFCGSYKTPEALA